MIFKLISFLFFLLFMVGLMIKMVISKSLISCYQDSPFECGISMNSSTRKSYSLPFFFVTIIFLLFDLEIIFIIPFVFFLYNFWIFVIFMLIIFTLLATLLMEWLYGSLKWLNL